MLALVGWKGSKKDLMRCMFIKNFVPIKGQTLEFVVWLKEPTKNQRSAMLQMIWPDVDGLFPKEIKGY